MFANKIFHFVKGYVIIRVIGFNIERFLNICQRRSIRLFSIGKRTDTGILVCVSVSDFGKIGSAADETGSHIRIIKRCGLPFLVKNLKKRYALIVSFFLLAVLFFSSSFFIWSIEINGNDEHICQSIAHACDKAGLRIGAYKPRLLSGEEMKNVILNNTDNLAWVWVYIKGTKAVVEYKEGICAPKVVDRTVPCNISAVRDGIIDKVIAKNGRAVVSSGDTVIDGDILISGSVDLENETHQNVHATGDVYAITWHEKSGDYKLYKTYYKSLGKKKTFRTIKLFSKCFDLFTSDAVDFDCYTISEKLSEMKLGKNNFLGIGMYKKTYTKTEPQRIDLSYDDVVEFAKNELEEKISKELLSGSVLRNKQSTVQVLDDSTIRVNVTMEFEEKIGKEVPIENYDQEK